MKRPLEQDYTSLVAYTRALEEYCDGLAQRTWVGLTDDEIRDVIAEVSQIPPIDFTTTTYGRAIEAKLKEKNDAA